MSDIRQLVDGNEVIPTFHTSILAFYPFRFYNDQAANILITPNPLSPQTIAHIGGNTQEIPTVTKARLVTVTHGTDPQIEEAVLQKISQLYKQVDVTQYQDMTIYNLVLNN